MGAAQRQRNVDACEWRLKNQSSKFRREYHLSDPDQLKHQVMKEEDLTISSFQRFEGEDVNYDSRIAEQRGIQKRWVAHQKEEKKQIAEYEEALERDFAATYEESNVVRTNFEVIKNREAKQREILNAEENKRIAVA